MSKRKAGDVSPSKRQPKKRAASNRHQAKPETPVAKAYRLKHAAKLAQSTTTAEKSNQESYDVYAFPPTLPSPPLSAQPTAPAESEDKITSLDDKNDDCNGEQASADSPIASTNIPEDTLLVMLRTFCDVEVTETALDAVMQHAAAAARPGDEFGVLFMRKFVSKLAGQPIAEAWLARVVDLLQQNLKSLCDRAQCQIGSLGKLALRKGKAPDSPISPARSGDAMQPVVDIKPEEPSRESEAKSKIATTKAASVPEDTREPKSHVMPVQSKQGRRSTKDTRPQTSLANPAQQIPKRGLAILKGAPQPWQPNDRTSSFHLPNTPLNSVYDLFLVSAIDAHCFAIEEPAEVVINAYSNYVRDVWRCIGSDQRAAWVKLFNARPDASSPSIRGQRLLETQGLLVKFLPDASVLKCKR